MKRLIAICLAMVLCLAVFVSCADIQEGGTETGDKRR